MPDSDSRVILTAMEVVIILIVMMGLMYGIPVGIAAIASAAKRGQFRESREQLALLPGVTALGASDKDPMTYKEAGRVVRFWPFVKNSQLWRFEAENVPLGRRTSFHLSTRVGMRPPAPTGMVDVYVEDALLDSSFFVWATNPELCARALAEPEVRRPLKELFSVARFLRLELDGKGELRVTFTGYDHATTVAEGYFRTFHALAAALDAADRVEALPRAEVRQLTGGAGGATGAPVSIPLNPGKK
jgi:hypothetical protein